jgi:LysR family transcriptional regulator, carnitine catabolism transcriptional activator
MVNIKHLKAFLAVASELHFTRAAEIVCVTQPALSALIQQLEQDLGIQLIRRHTRQVELTAAGKDFHGTALKLVHDFEQALHDLKTYKSVKRGRLDIAAVPSVCASLLPAVLKRFTSTYPDIRLNVLDISGQEIMDALKDKQIDFGLTYTQLSKEIEATFVMQDTLMLVCHKNNALAARKNIRWRELVDVPLIAMNQGTTIRTLIDSTALSKDMKLDIILEPKLMPTALSYVEADIGVTVLPSSGVRNNLPSQLVCIPMSEPTIKRDISLLKLRGMPLSPAAASFRKMLLEMCSAEDDSPEK